MIRFILGFVILITPHLPLRADLSLMAEGKLKPEGWQVTVPTPGAEAVQQERAVAVRIPPWSEDQDKWPRVVLSGPKLDLSACSQMEIVVRNTDDQPADIAFFASSGELRVASSQPLPPGEVATLRLNLSDPVNLDSSAVDTIGLYRRQPRRETRLEVLSISARAHPDFVPMRKILGNRITALQTLAPDAESKGAALFAKRVEVIRTMWEEASPGYASAVAKLIDETQRSAGIAAFQAREVPWMIWRGHLGERLAPDYFPAPSEPPLASVETTVLQHEYEPVCVNLTNAGEARRFTVELGGNKAEEPWIALREALFVKARDGSMTADALGEAVQKLELEVPADSTAQFLIWVDTKRAPLPAGEHRAEVVIRSGDEETGARESRLPVTVTTLPQRLASHVPFLYQNWAYFYHSRARVTAGREADALANLRDYGVNAFEIPYDQVPGPKVNAEGRYEGLADTGRFAAVLDLLTLQPEERVIIWLGFDHPERRRFGSSHEPHSAEWNETLLRYVADLKALLNERGIGPERWLLCCYDEASIEKAEDVARIFKLLHANDATLRFFDNTSAFPETREVLEGMLALPVQWMPNWDQFFVSQPEKAKQVVDALSDQKGQMGFYRCLMSRLNQGVDIHEYYRLMPWRLADNGWGTMGFWSYNAQHPNEDPWDGTQGSASGGIVVYEKDGQILTSRRWELLREGVEDYLMLQLLTGQEGALLDAGRNAQLAEYTGELLRSANGSDDADGPKNADAMRSRLLKEIAAKE